MQQISKVHHVDEQQIIIHDRVWVCSWHQNGQIMGTAGEDRTIKIWKFIGKKRSGDNKTNDFELQCTLRGDQNRSIRWVCFSPCGRFLASASFDATIFIYEYRQESNGWEELHRLEGHESEVKCCAFSFNGHYLATCSRDKSVWIWKADFDDEGGDFGVLSILQQHTGDVKFVVWHPQEEILLSGGYDGCLKFYIFDGDDWITAQTIQNAHDGTIWSAAFEPTNSNFLATVGGDKVIRIWMLQTNEPEIDKQNWHSWRKTVDLTFHDMRWPIYSVDWSRQILQQKIIGIESDIGLLAIGGGDRIVRIFSYNPDNESLSMVDSIRMDSEINCISWRPFEKMENDKLQLAVALDNGFVELLQIGG